MDSQTFLRYLDFLVAIKLRWSIYDCARSKSNLLALLEAVKRCSIEKIYLCLEDSLAESQELMTALETALTHHRTLQNITISWSSRPPNGMSGLFNALATIQPLSKLVILKESVPWEEEFKAFLDFLRAAKQLTVLKVPYIFTDTQMFEVLEALRDFPNLEKISLGSLQVNEKTVLKPLGMFLAERRIKYCFKYNYDYDKQEVIKSYTKSLEVPRASKNMKNWAIGYTSEAVTQLPNMETPFVDLLPVDVLKLILHHLNILPLLRFSMVTKRTREFCQRIEFWREYYLRHFDTLPVDVLEMISMLHGEKLLQANSIHDVVPPNMWLLALRHMPPYYWRPSYDKFPRDPDSYLRRTLERRFPQFFGYHLGPARYREKDAEDNIWFMKLLKDGQYLRLGFQKSRAGVYGGIFLIGGYYEDHTSRSKAWEMIGDVLDWKCAASAEELIDKCKDMCEAYLLAFYRRDWADKYTMYMKVVAPSVLKAFDLCGTAQQRINAVIDSRMNDVCARLTVDCSAVSDRLERFKTMPARSNDADYAVHRQRLMKRSELNRRYWSGNEWMDFNLVGWTARQEQQQASDEEVRVIAPASPRPKKMVPQALLMRLVRTLLNYIMMPLLKTFWPQDLTHKDSNYYAYFIDRTMLNTYKAHYSKNFTPVECLSVTSASPHCWPIIGVAVANLIVPGICDVVEVWISHQETNNKHDLDAKVSDLIDSLATLNLFSTAHLKAIRAIFELK